MLPPHPPGGGGGGRGLMGSLFGGGRAGRQLAELSMMDRDFGAEDYDMLLRLDEDNGRKKKSRLRENSKLIDQLPSHRVTKSELASKEEPTCAICLEAIRPQQSVTTLPCKHEYHRQCISKWLKSTEAASCPQCKAPALEPRGAGDESAEREPGAVSTADPWHTSDQHWHT